MAAVPPPPAVPDGARVEAVPLERIERDKPLFQFRLDDSSVADLVNSFKADGQQVPIMLWHFQDGEKLFIIDGHRRVRAAEELEYSEVRAVIRSDLEEEQAYRVAFAENTRRRGFGPLDKANALRIIRKREGVTLEEAAGYLGMTRSTAGRLVQLLELPDVLRQAVVAGHIASGHALVLGQHREEDLGFWVRRIQDEDLSVRQIQTLLGKAKRGRAPTYLQRRGAGFKLSGFSFLPSRCDPKTRQQMLEALKRALDILEGRTEP